MAKDLFDDTVLIDDEGNVIEEGAGTTTDKEKEDDKEELDSNEYMVDDQGRLLNEDGTPKEETEDEDSTDDDKSKDTNDEDDKKKSGDEDEPASASSTTKTLPPFANALKEAGVLPDLEIENEEEYTAENLIEAVRSEIKKSELSDLNDEQKEILELMRSGGDVGKYLEYYQTGTKAKEQFKEITEDNAEEFTRQYHRLKGLSDEEIEEIIDDRTINGTLTEKASKLKESYDAIVEQKKKEQLEVSKQKQAELQKEAEQSLQEYRKAIDSTEEFIKGHKLTKDIKDKIYELGTKPITTKDGNQMTAMQKFISDDPIKAEAKLNYLYLITDGFDDSKMKNLTYSKAAKSSAVKDLERQLEQEKNLNKGASSPKGGNENKNKPSILDAKF